MPGSGRRRRGRRPAPAPARSRTAARRSRTDTRRGSARLRRARRARSRRARRAGRRSRARRRRAARRSRCASAARLAVGGHVSGETSDLDRDHRPRTRPLSPSSFAVICMRARPTARARQVEAHLRRAAAGHGHRLLARRPRPRSTDGSRLRMVTMAVPLSLQLAVDDGAEARACRRRRGSAGTPACSSTGLLMRISRSPRPKREALSPATAMMRYVVRDSGSVTSVAAVAARVGDDRAEPEREHAEVLAHGRARALVRAAAAALVARPWRRGRGG